MQGSDLLFYALLAAAVVTLLVGMSGTVESCVGQAIPPG